MTQSSESALRSALSAGEEGEAIARFKETEAAISLHGLGFIQVKLGGKQRLHVWHPDLPRRRCYEHSLIHDHRFGFESRVLVGEQINRTHAFINVPADGSATHIGYLHDGPRSARGNRPWIPDLCLKACGVVSTEHVPAGQTYHMLPGVYHSTEPGGDGRVATLMTKTVETDVAAHSLCEIGVEPDADFDRFQWPDDTLWVIVCDVLGRQGRRA